MNFRETGGSFVLIFNEFIEEGFFFNSTFTLYRS